MMSRFVARNVFGFKVFSLLLALLFYRSCGGLDQMNLFQKRIEGTRVKIISIFVLCQLSRRVKVVPFRGLVNARL